MKSSNHITTTVFSLTKSLHKRGGGMTNNAENWGLSQPVNSGHAYAFIILCLYYKSGFLHDVFWAALLSDRSDDCLRSVFMPLHVAIDSV